jgi:hypothetical protein
MLLHIKQDCFLFYLATERHRKHGKRFIGLVATCFGRSLYIGARSLRQVLLETGHGKTGKHRNEAHMMKRSILALG